MALIKFILRNTYGQNLTQNLTPQRPSSTKPGPRFARANRGEVSLLTKSLSCTSGVKRRKGGESGRERARRPSRAAPPAESHLLLSASFDFLVTTGRLRRVRSRQDERIRPQPYIYLNAARRDLLSGALLFSQNFHTFKL